MSFQLLPRQEFRSALVELHHGCCWPRIVYALLMIDFLSHLTIVMLAWQSTILVLPAYLLVHLAMAVYILGAKEALAPLFWFFPRRSTLLNLREDITGPTHSKWWYMISYGLRLAMLAGFLVCSAVMPLKLKKINTLWKIHESCSQTAHHDCESLPAWLKQVWWSSGATCFVHFEWYQSCLGGLPWWLQAYCDSDAATCFATSYDLSSLLCISISLSLMLMLLRRLLSWIGRCFQTDTYDSLDFEERGLTGPSLQADASEEAPDLWAQARVYRVILLLFLDLFTDAMGVVQYVFTGNLSFAVISAAILGTFLVQQVRGGGGWFRFKEESLESLKVGKVTDGLQITSLSQQLVVAPLQLFLQSYSVEFVSSSSLVLVSLSLSMLLSLVSVADAAYTLLELDLMLHIRRLR